MADQMQRGNPISQNRSIANPADATMMAQKGQIQPGMTVRQLITDVLKVPLDAPAQALAEAVKRQGMNASMQGKMQSMGGQRPRPRPAPQGQPEGMEGLLRGI